MTRKRYQYKDGSHDERIVIECSLQQKLFVFEAANKANHNSGLRPWALPLLLSESKKVLGKDFDTWLKDKK